MKVRPVTEKDAADLAALNNKFNQAWDTEHRIVERMRASPPGEIVLIAEIKEKAIGFACLRISRSICYDSPLAELTELYVEEAHRQQGAGRALVELAEDIARTQGAEVLMLLTNDKNSAAQEFYRSVGYQMMPDVVMSKKFSDK